MITWAWVVSIAYNCRKMHKQQSKGGKKRRRWGLRWINHCEQLREEEGLNPVQR